MAYKSFKKRGKRVTPRYKKSVRATASKRSATLSVLRAAPTVSKIARKAMLSMSETKYKLRDQGKLDLYHDNGKNFTANTMNLYGLNSFASDYLPGQGTQDDQRIGDSISISGWKVRMILGAQGDRPNVTYRIVAYQARQNASLIYDQIFKNQTSNVLLDTWDRDRSIKVLYDKVIKKGSADYTLESGSTQRDYTFMHRFFVKAPQKHYKFQTQGGYIHQHGNIWVHIFAYDSYGTLGTDKLGFVQCWTECIYKDI